MNAKQTVSTAEQVRGSLAIPSRQTQDKCILEASHLPRPEHSALALLAAAAAAAVACAARAGGGRGGRARVGADGHVRERCAACTRGARHKRIVWARTFCLLPGCMRARST
eukprot:6174381-Pleurochrysis_carterae.AAC.1